MRGSHFESPGMDDKSKQSINESIEGRMDGWREGGMDGWLTEGNTLAYIRV
jgi:hypothetical protein